MRASGGLRVVVLGYVVRGPLGGMTLHHLQYVLGLAELGHDVWFVEYNDWYPSCYNPVTFELTIDPAFGLRYAAEVFAKAGLDERWAFFDVHRDRWQGPARDHIADVLKSADVVVNVSGVNSLDDALMAVPHRVLIDTDPGFTQARHLAEPDRLALAVRHNRHFTFAETVGRGAQLADDGLAWMPTRQPVVLDRWPVVVPPPDAPFTTVMQWDSYDTVEHSGVVLGMKSTSFASFMRLPSLVPDEVFELAMGSKDAPRESLRSAGWRTRDPGPLSADPWTYQRYIQGSKGEFTVAKHGYVVTRSGWFSERSAGYLASGRPVLSQDTDFSSVLPTGEGLLAFSTLAEAVVAVREVTGRYARHAVAARDLASAYFDSRSVLESLLERATSQAGDRVVPHGQGG